MNLYEVSWAVRHEPGGSYVVEHEDDLPKKTYGPMPAHLVPAFLRDRQAIMAWSFDRAIAEANRRLRDAKDPTHQTEPLSGAGLPQR